jgi:hypothetical protein
MRNLHLGEAVLTIANLEEDAMRKSGTFLLAVGMALATVSAPALAQNGGHMMGDHDQGMMGDNNHGQGMMGDDGQGTMGNNGHMMGDDDHGQGTMGNGGHMMGDDNNMMGNGHNMSGHDGQ